jgi:hypothetical protein
MIRPLRSRKLSFERLQDRAMLSATSGSLESVAPYIKLTLNTPDSTQLSPSSFSKSNKSDAVNNAFVQFEEQQTFDIVLHPSTALTNNANALASFERAAAFWESVFADPITVNIDADYSSTGFPPGRLGETTLERTFFLCGGGGTITPSLTCTASDSGNDYLNGNGFSNASQQSNLASPSGASLDEASGLVVSRANGIGMSAGAAFANMNLNELSMAA